MNNSNGTDQTILSKMNLSQAINKLSLIGKLEFLESSDKMAKSLKFMLQSQVSKLSEIADCLTFSRVCQMQNSHMFRSSNLKVAYCFAEINGFCTSCD